MLDLYKQVRPASATASKTSDTFALLGEDDISRAAQLGWYFIAPCLDRLALTQHAQRLRAAHEDA